MALHPDVMRTAFGALLSACEQLCEAASLAWPEPTVATRATFVQGSAMQLQSCLQHQVAWAALMQRSVPAHALAGLLESAFLGRHLQRVLPSSLDAAWTVVQRPAHAAAQASTSVGVDEDVHPAVAQLVQRAFSLALAQLETPSEQAAAAPPANAAALPLWLAVCSQLSLLLQAPVLPALSSVRNEERPAAPAVPPALRMEALSLVAVLVTLLHAADPFGTAVHLPAFGDTAAQDVLWTRAVGAGLTRVLAALLNALQPQDSAVNRACAAAMLNLMCYSDAAVACAVGFLRAAFSALTLSPATSPSVLQFRLLYGVSLLQTALKRPALLAGSSALIAEGVVGCLEPVLLASPSASRAVTLHELAVLALGAAAAERASASDAAVNSAQHSITLLSIAARLFADAALRATLPEERGPANQPAVMAQPTATPSAVAVAAASGSIEAMQSAARALVAAAANKSRAATKTAAPTAAVEISPLSRLADAMAQLLRPCMRHGQAGAALPLVLNVVDLLIAVRAALLPPTRPEPSSTHAVPPPAGATTLDTPSSLLARSAGRLLCVLLQQPVPLNGRLRQLVGMVCAAGLGLIDHGAAAAFRMGQEAQLSAPLALQGADDAASRGGGLKQCRALDISTAIGVQVGGKGARFGHSAICTLNPNP